jgi:hypothetical protein
MTIRLHRCSAMWAKFGAHPCWNVQKALDEEEIERIRAGSLFQGAEGAR